MRFEKAPDIQKRISFLVKKLTLSHVRPQNIVAFRSYGSRARARARIWSFPRIWQLALDQAPHYCLEVLSEKFDRLSEDDQVRVLIHELLHIPKNFSGALLPHRGRGKPIDRKAVEKLFKKLR
jgi:predicted metallopeptidase